MNARESSTVDEQQGVPDGDGEAGVLAEYAAGHERPVGAYVVLTSVYTGACAAAVYALRVRGRPLPERVHTGDILLVGIASHKLARLIAKDKVTSFVRAPFTRYREAGGHGEVEEEPRGTGLRLAVGEFLVCPYCIGQWVATALMVGLVASPRLTRAVSSVFVAHTISDFLQVAYRAAEDSL
jgi:Protein of unknown function (DUF1360)